MNCFLKLFIESNVLLIVVVSSVFGTYFELGVVRIVQKSEWLK